MCQVGGPRCHTEAARRFATSVGPHREAQQTLDRLLTNPSFQAMPADARDIAAAPHRERAREARQAHYDALCDLAATPRGATEVEAMYANADTVPPFHPGMVRAEAEWRNTRGRMIRRMRTEGGPETVVGFLGDPEDDRLILQAAEAFAANAGEHRKPVGELPKVKHYTNEAERARGIARWMAATQAKAETYRQALNRLAVAEADFEQADSTDADDVTRALTWARLDVNEAETDLVLVAEKLRIAKSRVVPTAADVAA